MQYLEYEAADFLSVQLIPLTVCEKVYAPFLISTFFFFLHFCYIHLHLLIQFRVAQNS